MVVYLPENRKLTLKQQRFADEYIITGNATESAIRAGYSKNSAKEIASENLTKPNIKSYIDKRLEELESDKIADQKEVLEYLTAVMRREKSENVVVTLREKTDRYVPDEDGNYKREVVETERAEIVEIPSKLSDSNKAAELIGKRYGLFTDKIDLEVDSQVVIIDDLD